MHGYERKMRGSSLGLLINLYIMKLFSNNNFRKLTESIKK